MPHCNRLLLPLAAAMLLTAGTAHAEARRAAQSLPAAARFSPPAAAQLRTATSTKTGIGERDDASSRGRGDRNRYDNRRYDHDRDDYERGKDREGHHFGHHDRDHDDSPGC